MKIINKLLLLVFILSIFSTAKALKYQESGVFKNDTNTIVESGIINYVPYRIYNELDSLRKNNYVRSARFEDGNRTRSEAIFESTWNVGCKRGSTQCSLTHSQMHGLFMRFSKNGADLVDFVDYFGSIPVVRVDNTMLSVMTMKDANAKFFVDFFSKSNIIHHNMKGESTTLIIRGFNEAVDYIHWHLNTEAPTLRK